MSLGCVMVHGVVIHLCTPWLVVVEQFELKRKGMEDLNSIASGEEIVQNVANDLSIAMVLILGKYL